MSYNKYHFDYREEVFPLNHFALFCKGWYKSIDEKEDIFETIYRILNLDGYGYIKDQHSALCLILSNIDRYNEWLKENNKQCLNLYDLYDETYKNIKWRNICNSFEEGILLRIISFIQGKGCDEIKLEKPVYNRKLRKKDGILFNMMFHKDYRGMTYKEQNSFASKIFDK